MSDNQPTGRFEPTVESLLNYECPTWFRDAKFGIYLHWGAYSVAEQGEWYARQMYMEGHPDYEHHIKTYGHPSEFGYKDFIPMWKAERFDPDRLVELFKKAGARYFSPCAIHHDNFDLWNSKHHKWNAVNMGPKKDITGLWRDACLKQGLRFGVTTHLSRAYSWFNVNKGADTRGPYKGVGYDGNDPAYRDFYFEPHPDTNRHSPLNPPPEWRRQWALRIKDLIDNYHPDHLYFDACVPFLGEDHARTGLEVIAHYYNRNMERHDGRQEGVMCIKNVPEHGYFFSGITTLDIERSRSDRALLWPWQTDTSIGPWGYKAGAAYRSATEIVQELVDIASKNGNLLLNVPPRADGTLDDKTEDILLGIGAWLDVNGEAIYGTRPWDTPAEENIRFMKKGDAIYAVVFDSPSPGQQVTIRVLAAGDTAGRITGISMLGCAEEIQWKQYDEELTITMPQTPAGPHACAFRITLVG